MVRKPESAQGRRYCVLAMGKHNGTSRTTCARDVSCACGSIVGSVVLRNDMKSGGVFYKPAVLSGWFATVGERGEFVAV